MRKDVRMIIFGLMSDTQPIRVILLDDHQVVLDGLQSILSQTEEVEVLGEFLSPEKAMSFLDANEVDVILTDLDMPIMSGEDVLLFVKSKFPRTKVLVLSMHNEKTLIKHLIDLGADGYVSKSASKDEILMAVTSVCGDVKFFSNDVLKSLMAETREVKNTIHPALKELTTREVDVIKLIAEGLSSKEIGERLCISPRTAETHRSNVMKKINCTGVAGIVRFAFETKLIS